jgi:hypothetical protein
MYNDNIEALEFESRWQTPEKRQLRYPVAREIDKCIDVISHRGGVCTFARAIA